mmetsp:Transcript_124636/g.278162  ORF Transcript_124636/g.278162 Transcript_124636/m.278162 type:complete len:246 (-) Transcript_124636:303-1040(-)
MLVGVLDEEEVAIVALRCQSGQITSQVVRHHLATLSEEVDRCVWVLGTSLHSIPGDWRQEQEVVRRRLKDASMEQGQWSGPGTLPAPAHWPPSHRRLPHMTVCTGTGGAHWGQPLVPSQVIEQDGVQAATPAAEQENISLAAAHFERLRTREREVERVRVLAPLASHVWPRPQGAVYLAKQRTKDAHDARAAMGPLLSHGIHRAQEPAATTPRRLEAARRIGGVDLRVGRLERWWELTPSAATPP